MTETTKAVLRTALDFYAKALTSEREARDRAAEQVASFEEQIATREAQIADIKAALSDEA